MVKSGAFLNENARVPLSGRVFSSETELDFYDIVWTATYVAERLP
jgi:hypothetical protein